MGRLAPKALSLPTRALHHPHTSDLHAPHARDQHDLHAGDPHASDLHDRDCDL